MQVKRPPTWSPSRHLSTTLHTPGEHLTLRRMLKRSRENIRNSRNDFFGTSPRSDTGITAAADRGAAWWKNNDEDRLSVPVIHINSSSQLPTPGDGSTTSSFNSVRFLNDGDSIDEEVTLRRKGSDGDMLSPGHITRSRSFQEQGNCSVVQHTGRFYVKRISTGEDTLPRMIPNVLHDSTVSNLDHQPTYDRLHSGLDEVTVPYRAASDDTGNCRSGLHQERGTAVRILPSDSSHVFSRFVSRMRKIAMDWRRAKRKVDKGELLVFYQSNVGRSVP